MRILIATGIFPPDSGGPAYYAQELKKEFIKRGYIVWVRRYTIERYLPTGVRHFVYLLKTLPVYLRSDLIIALDTFSVGLPIALLNLFFHRKVLLRTGGDFLWEQYIERTGEKVLFSEFYMKPRVLSLKEQIIFSLTRWTLNHVSRVVFSTPYQRDIWKVPYKLNDNAVAIVENCYYGVSRIAKVPMQKNFVCIVRKLKWKNIDTLERAFIKAQRKYPDIILEVAHTIRREDLLLRLQKCYAAILVSLGDISPNFVLEALSFGKPVILTQENGLVNRLKNAVTYVNPLDEEDIAEKISMLSERSYYEYCVHNAKMFSFEHSYSTIVDEMIALGNSLS